MRVASPVQSAPFSSAAALRSAALFGATGLALSAVKLTTGFGIGCPWRHLTGTLCPLCGATTMGTRLLVGDPAGAWAANPFVLALLGLGALAVTAWTVEAVGGPALRPPQALRSPALWWSLLGAAALAFTIWRNI